MKFVKRAEIENFINGLASSFSAPGKIFFIGETSQVMEGWRTWTDKLEFFAEVSAADISVFDETINKLRENLQIEIIEESPADIIPLPEGAERRSRKIEIYQNGLPLHFYHFDPYSCAFRYIARGDEQDYKIVLAYVKHEWITISEMDKILEELLKSFSFKTIQQDPAEFRRKYKGLLQMWRAGVSV